MKTIEIQIKDYITNDKDVITVIKKLIKDKKKILLQAPMGTGKSSLILDYLSKEFNILMAIPNTAQIETIEQRKDIFCLHGNKKKNNYKQENTIVSTPDRLLQAKECLTKIDCLIIDEAHEVYTTASYRPKFRNILTLQQTLENSSILHMSATPQATLTCLKGFYDVFIKINSQKKLRTNIDIYDIDLNPSNIKNVINKYKAKHSNTYIYFDDKSVNEELATELDLENINADNKKDSQILSEIKIKRKINKNIIFTSVIRAGLDILNEENAALIIVAKSNLTTDDAIQLIGRFRNNLSKAVIIKNFKSKEENNNQSYEQILKQKKKYIQSINNDIKRWEENRRKFTQEDCSEIQKKLIELIEHFIDHKEDGEKIKENGKYKINNHKVEIAAYGQFQRNKIKNIDSMIKMLQKTEAINIDNIEKKDLNKKTDKNFNKKIQEKNSKKKEMKTKELNKKIECIVDNLSPIQLELFLVGAPLNIIEPMMTKKQIENKELMEAINKATSITDPKSTHYKIIQQINKYITKDMRAALKYITQKELSTCKRDIIQEQTIQNNIAWVKDKNVEIATDIIKNKIIFVRHFKILQIIDSYELIKNGKRISKKTLEEIEKTLKEEKYFDGLKKKNYQKMIMQDLELIFNLNKNCGGIRISSIKTKSLSKEKSPKKQPA
ncbi:hypothetical protein AN639_11730 [Candidatus Epulonipiscium fishelsonii]|uniref:Uncharacterized protein n=1 Tax=Candidatus Epulonipiscium fishelsonii TaxID=77094 RepID=A0ACC8XD34_9FIRM|nr:hypothetical protein AN396_05285 [Epulopiscium sp. SCG-B11WGA-EpuloA1]ONI42940.1 hypothetical protein AN639_11730 [Epulopiscium sp. SCG-B05WGA-EpuloA1]ONI48389.1 hypothetical protein AN643_01630 [Epulopiscium sp. SCG-B10WGA-EpuloB]